MTESGRRFQIRVSPWLRWLLRPAGMGGRRSGVFVTPDTVTVRAAGFRVDVPRSDIASVGQERGPWWALGGVHTNLRGRWIVRGALGDVVRLDLARPAEGRLAGIGTNVRRLDVGVADEEALLAELRRDPAG